MAQLNIEIPDALMKRIRTAAVVEEKHIKAIVAKALDEKFPKKGGRKG